VLARTVVVLVFEAVDRSRVKVGRPGGRVKAGSGSAMMEVAEAFVLELGDGSEDAGMERGICAE